MLKKITVFRNKNVCTLRNDPIEIMQFARNTIKQPSEPQNT